MGRVDKYEIFETGKYVIRGVLKPVKINIEKNIGEYMEPNVWVLHEVDHT